MAAHTVGEQQSDCLFDYSKMEHPHTFPLKMKSFSKDWWRLKYKKTRFYSAHNRQTLLTLTHINDLVFFCALESSYHTDCLHLHDEAEIIVQYVSRAYDEYA
jgi:hypothetical protein